MCDLEPVDRRSFLVQAASATAGIAVGCRGARPESDPPRDASLDGDIRGEMVSFKSGGDLVRGYLEGVTPTGFINETSGAAITDLSKVNTIV